MAAEWTEWTLAPQTEFRFEVDFKETVAVRLKSGKAEIFGVELAQEPEYSFTGKKIAIFTWHGAVISVKGKCAVEYTAGDTPMVSYLNVHLALEQERRNCDNMMNVNPDNKDISGPKVMVIGPHDVGKTSLCKILLNYAVKSERKPLFFDIDTNEGSLSLPGTIAATAFTKLVDVEEDLGGTSSTASSITPLVYYYGYSTPQEKSKLYTRLVTSAMEIINKKYEEDVDVRKSGMVINTPSQFTDSEGYDLLKKCIEIISPTCILVIGHERLFSDLNRQYQSKDSGIQVVKLAKSGGVVARDQAFRRKVQNAKIREYFYGTVKNQLSPYSNIVSYNDVIVRRVNEGTLAPSSALPLGMERKADQIRLLKVEAGDILLNSILAVSNADRLDAAPTVGSAPALTMDQEAALVLDRSVIGFIYVSEVEDEKHRLTVLTPVPGRLPKKFMIMGGLKWLEMS